ncbi:MAG TPA: V-type ATPase subunit [Clostridiales bacterium]|nr:V-type ATPase subunit [Clostridiales bacterium]
MPDKLYIYAVARIRSKELQLLDAQFIEQLMAAPGYGECMHLLINKGWGREGFTEPEQILDEEYRKAWSFISELVEDMSVFEVLLLPNDYHNLKAAIKMVYTGTANEGYFSNNGTINHDIIMEAVKTKDFSLLPEHMQKCAPEAYETLLHTGDGQLCDIIIDRAALEALYKAGKESGSEVIKAYTELKTAASNIRIAVRAHRTGKSLEWMERAMSPCDTLDIGQLSQAAASGFEEICEYLRHTEYADGVKELEKSLSSFERWCEDLLIRKIRPQKYNSFTIDPLAAYLIARDNEIKTVRIILLGKLNQLPEDIIRERLREMYV